MKREWAGGPLNTINFTFMDIWVSKIEMFHDYSCDLKCRALTKKILHAATAFIPVIKQIYLHVLPKLTHTTIIGTRTEQKKS